MNLSKLPYEQRTLYHLYISTLVDNIKIQDLLIDLINNDDSSLTNYGTYYKKFVGKYLNE